MEKKRLIFFIVLLIHGIAHLLGVSSIVGGILESEGYTIASWVLSDMLGLSEVIVRTIGVLWLVATVGFVAAAWGFWSELEWWRP